MEKLVVIAGTNASGKSDLAVKIAQAVDGEVISADSRQVFKGLDLGSGKIRPDEMKGVPHHLLDVAEPDTYFSLAHYQRLAYEAIDDVIMRGKRPVLVGGTGLYINAVADGYELEPGEPVASVRTAVEGMNCEDLLDIIRKTDPAGAETLDPHNKRRLERAAEKVLTGRKLENSAHKRYETFVLGVTWPRAELYERIEERLKRRLDEDMIGEVAGLRAAGVSDDFLYRLGLEYRYILLYLQGQLTYETFYEELFKEIRHLAKEQMTWFRKRKDIIWIDMKDDPLGKALEHINAFLT
ncbi:MAG: tRNA (adenosine(37)-N6)-dimethylallyltransferase MiaA [Lachnospiraceae bacterium]|nr:tRNA (adenosine(37)-N6)-dimethylallyltransferase MiaA [Lachnospiraceae bacterium]